MKTVAAAFGLAPRKTVLVNAPAPFTYDAPPPLTGATPVPVRGPFNVLGAGG